MMRWILIGAALLAALAAVALTRGYLSGKERQIAAEHTVPMTDVLVTATELEVGQSVSERNLIWQRWPSTNLHARYVTREKQPDAIRRLTGAAARQPLFAGEPVTDAKLVKRDGASVLAVALKDGHRAVTIKVDEAQGLAGLVKPGDLVDVILTHKVPLPGATERADREVAEVIAAGVRVLGVGQDIKSDDKNKLAKSITIEVGPAEAEAVALGRALGILSLALRSAFADAGDPDRPHAYTSLDDISSVAQERRKSGPVMLVAARPLPAGVLLAEGDVAWARTDNTADATTAFVQDRERPPGLRGALLLQPVGQGQPLPRGKVVKPSDARFVPLALQPGHRAVSVTVAPNSAVGGFIAAGDLVDVIFTDEVDDQTQGAVLRQRNWSETVATSVRVLSIETSLDPKTQLPKAGGTATLEATPRQAEEIALAANMGKLTLTLRPVDDEPTEVAQGGASSLVGGTFTIDKDMSRGLDAIVGGGARSGGSMVVFRGAVRTVVTLDR